METYQGSHDAGVVGRRLRTALGAAPCAAFIRCSVHYAVRSRPTAGRRAEVPARIQVPASHGEKAARLPPGYHLLGYLLRYHSLRARLP